MTKVLLSKVKSNPWRDLELYPIDESQVERLKQSIDWHGFLGGIKARQVNGHYEIGCGHHRIEAARQLKLKELDIVVDDMTDDEMIQLMCTENATQKSHDPAAIMNEVAAATKRIAAVLLKCSNHTDLTSQLCEVSVAKAIDGQKGFARARGAIEGGEGLGEPILARYFGHGDEGKCRRSKPQLREAIASLKDSGIYTRILQDIGVEIEQEEAEVEEEIKKAPAKKTPEKKKQQEDLKQAKTTSSKAAANSKEKYGDEDSAILDPKCAKLFPNDHQWAAFKEAVTTESARRFIDKSQQYKLAQTLMKELTGKTRSGERVGAPFIKSYVASVISEAVAKQRHIDKEEAARLEHEQTANAARARVQSASSHMSSLIGDFTKLLDLLKKHPKVKNDSFIGALGPKVDAAIKVLQAFKREAGV